MVNEEDWEWAEGDGIREIIIDFHSGEGLKYTITEDDSDVEKKYFLIENDIEIISPSQVIGSDTQLDNYHRFWKCTRTNYQSADEPFPSVEDAKYAAMVFYYRYLSAVIAEEAYDDHPTRSVPYMIRYFYENHRVWKPNDEPTFEHYRRQIQLAELKLRFVESFSPEQRADIMQCRSPKELCERYGDSQLCAKDFRRVQKFLPEDLTPEAIETARRDLSIMCSR